MRTKTTLVMLVIVLIAMLCPILALGNNIETLERKAKLEALVDEYIAVCDAKFALRSSKSENIRRSAMRSCKIATFCKNASEELVDAMLENNIEPKAYKVRYFLNARFQDRNASFIHAKEQTSE